MTTTTTPMAPDSSATETRRDDEGGGGRRHRHQHRQQPDDDGAPTPTHADEPLLVRWSVGAPEPYNEGGRGAGEGDDAEAAGG